MSSDGDHLGAAVSIGRDIVADAVWHDGRCSWMGAFVDGAQPRRPQYRALGASVYDGTAGVGLFLAQLAAATGDPAVRNTALGAFHHAVATTFADPPARRDGFHAGVLGIAWACSRVAALLDAEDLHAAARSLLVAAKPADRPDRSADVVLGTAGSILGLLALADAFDDVAPVDEARGLGEQLVDRATVTRHGWSWGVPGHRHPHHLCGLAHGAAGIGWALLELFDRTGDERFATAAAGAFAYERSWFDATSGTWPDLRIPGQRRGAAPGAISPATGTWCHGEGGIALTRLRALDVLDPESCGHDAEIALEATRRALAGALPHDLEDLTLCHGAAGAADVLLCGRARLGERWSEAANPADRLACVALERFVAAGESWPCDAAGGTTPGLFRGTSGIGWWFLRLHDPALPSALRMPDWPLTSIDARA
jgi:lantibiotic modifying enzyme